MNKNEVKGKYHEAKGGLKEKAGQAIGDTKLEAEGKAERVGGKIQKNAGRAVDRVLHG